MSQVSDKLKHENWIKKDSTRIKSCAESAKLVLNDPAKRKIKRLQLITT